VILKVMSVHDSKVGSYHRPFFQRSIGEAMRSWESIVNDPQTEFAKFPGDFTLFQVGEYDESTGILTPLSPLKSLGTGLEVRKQQ